MKWLKRIGIVLAIVLVLLGAALWWLLGTRSGLRFALDRVVAASDGALTVERADGRLAGPLRLRGIHYRDAAGGLDARVRQASADPQLWALLAGRLHLRHLEVSGVRVAMTTPPQPPPESGEPLSLQPPLDMVLDRAHIADIHVSQDGEPLFTADTLDVAGAWTAAGLDLRQLKLRSPAGHVDLRGQLALAKGYAGDGHGTFAWTVDDTKYAGTLAAHSDGRQAHVELELSQPAAATLVLDLQQTHDYPWTARLDVPGFDPHTLLDDTSLKALAVDLQGHGDRYRGTLEGRVQLNDIQFQLQPLAAHFDAGYTQLTLDRLDLTSPQIEGRLHGSGVVQLDAQPMSADLALQWRDVVVPEKIAGQELASRGDIVAKGSARAFHVQGDVDIGPPGQLAKLSLDLDGTPQQITLHTLALKQPEGGLQAQGTLDLQPQLGWKLDVKADDLDPGQLFAGWDGALDADLDTHGRWNPDGPQATLQLHKLTGTLRQRAISGDGNLTLHPNRVIEGHLALASGGSRVQLTATGSQQNRIDLRLAVESLGDWMPDASGRVDGHFRIRGLWPKLAVVGDLKGAGLATGTTHVESLDLHVDVPDTSRPGGKLHLAASGAGLGGLTFTTVTVDGRGDAAHHTLRLDANGEPLSLRLALDGSMRGKAWNGTLSTLDLSFKDLPPWRLQQPSQLSWNDGAASLSQTCLSAGEPELCVSGEQDTRGNLKASYSLRQMPLALLTTMAGGDLPLRSEGIIEGQGDIQRSAAGVLGGHASLTSPEGSIRYTDNPAVPLLDYRDFTLTADLAPDRQHVVLSATLNDGGRLAGDVSISGAQQALAGQVTLRLQDLSFIELFSTDIANVGGNLDGDFRLGGTLAAPDFNGQAVLDGFAAELPALGLKLHDGHVAIATTAAGQLRIDGQVVSGDGTLTLAGTTGIGETASTDIAISGSQFLAADIPAAKVVVSPDLKVRQDAEGLDIGGTLSIDSATIKLDKLPGGGNATRASPDVVVVDAEREEDAEQAAALPITADIAVDLGSHTHIVGYGLDGQVSGRLRVVEVPGKATTGQGQIVINGTYRAYGQDLHIQQGRLLFAGTPIDNPGLDIRAVRELHPNATIDEGQEVGLQISGTAKRPVMTVFSNPAMEQADALSYLITGKPLSQVKGGEGDMVGAAAQALGSAAGDLLAKGIGSRLGIEAGVSSSEALGTSAFTVGKYLSPRLYISYGVGLFDPGQVITLRYILSHRWNFEAEQATDFSRASFNYRYEK